MFDSLRKTLDELESTFCGLFKSDSTNTSYKSDAAPLKLNVFSTAASYTVDGAVKLFTSVVITNSESNAVEKTKQKARELNPDKIVNFNSVIAIQISKKTVDRIKKEC